MRTTPTNLLLAALQASISAMEAAKDSMSQLAEDAGDVPEWNDGGHAREACKQLREALAIAALPSAVARAQAAGDLVVGQQVCWLVRHEGGYKVAAGVIAAVVRAEDDPRKCVPAGFMVSTTGRPRAHRSYLVQVANSHQLQWPQVSDLGLPA